MATTDEERRSDVDVMPALEMNTGLDDAAVLSGDDRDHPLNRIFEDDGRSGDLLSQNPRPPAFGAAEWRRPIRRYRDPERKWPASIREAGSGGQRRGWLWTNIIWQPVFRSFLAF